MRARDALELAQSIMTVLCSNSSVRKNATLPDCHFCHRKTNVSA